MGVSKDGQSLGERKKKKRGKKQCHCIENQLVLSQKKLFVSHRQCFVREIGVCVCEKRWEPFLMMRNLLISSLLRGDLAKRRGV